MPKFASFTMTFPYEDSEYGRQMAEDVLDTLAEFGSSAGEDLNFDAHMSGVLDADDPYLED